MNWPGYIKPEEDEIFTSWFYRLSKEHRIKSHTFSKFFFDGLPIWNRDIDQYCPEIIKRKIYEHTPLSKDRIENLFLSSFDGIVFNDVISTKSLLSIGINHRKRRKFGLLYCIGCLEKEVKFFKKSWRLTSSLVCLECSLKLLDSCPHCNSPIAFHRLENGIKGKIPENDLNSCYKCLRDITKTDKIYADDDSIKYQKYINNTIDFGFNDLTQYSFTFFSVLHELEHKLYSRSKKWNKFRIEVEKYRSISMLNKNLNRIKSREESLLITYELLESWPQKFINFLSGRKLTYSDFSKDFRDIPPFWFSNVLKFNI
ncbi:TniQ family protein [Flavobacterium sp. C4GT6]|uniref:TniQ family protein n=1 Tax=Flavobacterium sp. C4GT6 TaxID=3103818 RepID=UPI002ED4A63A